MLFIIKRDVFTQNLSNAMGLVNPVDTADLKHQGICSHIVIRKSKDYVYSIWVYKVLNMWKGYYRVKQEQRLKHRNTNSKYIGAECPPPKWVKKKHPLQPGNQPVKFQTTNTCTYVAAKKWSHCETVALWNTLGTCKTSSIPLRCHWKPDCQRRSSLSLNGGCFVDTARLPCAFAPIFMVRSYFQCCCQSI